MPIKLIDEGLDGEAPLGNHLGLVLQSGQVAAIPEGTLLILYDAKVGHPIMLVLQKVSTGKLVMGLVGPDGKVHTEYTYKLTTGKPLTRTAYERLKKEGKVA